VLLPTATTLVAEDQIADLRMYVVLPEERVERVRSEFGEA
jgi:hypothetical protein